MLTLNTLLANYTADNTSERFGQWFCNRYIKGVHVDIYYETDMGVAKDKIGQWLKDNCYEHDMPEKIHRSL